MNRGITCQKSFLYFFLFGLVVALFLPGTTQSVFAAEAVLWDKNWLVSTDSSGPVFDSVTDTAGNTYTIGFSGSVSKQGPNSIDSNPLWPPKNLRPSWVRAIALNAAKTSLRVYVTSQSSIDYVYPIDFSGNTFPIKGLGHPDALYDGNVFYDAADRIYLIGQGINNDWWVYKYGANGGSPLWANNYAGSGANALRPIDGAVDPASRDVYVVGAADGPSCGGCMLVVKHRSSDGVPIWSRFYQRTEFAPSGDLRFTFSSSGTFGSRYAIKFVSSNQIYVAAPSYLNATTQHVLLARIDGNNGNILGSAMVSDGANYWVESGRHIAVSPSGIINVGGISFDIAGNGKLFFAKFDFLLSLIEPVMYTPAVNAPSLRYGGSGMALGEIAGYFYQGASQIISGSEYYRLVKYGPNAAPVANNQSASTNYQTAKSIILAGSDANGCGQSFTFAVITQPVNGAISPASGTATCSGGNLSANVTYTPNAGFSGNNSFTFKFNDGIADSNIATVSITVNAVAPTVISPTATSIIATSATLGANVTSNGGAVLTTRGTCWGTSPSPATNCLAEGSTATGIFSHSRTGLPSGTLIYYRGYATNSVGTGYSPDGSFTTGSSDTTAPTTSASGTAPPGGSAYSFGAWTNQNVGVALSCVDSGTGCASGYPRYCTDTINTCVPGTAYSGRVDISTLGTSYIRFYSRDNAGNTESTQSRTIRIDKTLPTNPSNLTATAASCSQINLSWTGSSDSGGSGLKEYIIYRGAAEIARTTSTSYSNTMGLSPNTSYSYYIKAQDNAGNVSAASNTASAITPSCGGSLSVTSVNPSSGPTTGGTAVAITGNGFSNGTVGFWHMDETSGTSVADSSGNNNTAIANGATIVTGRYGNARSFNGSGNTVNAPLAVDPSAYAITAWIKPSTTSSGSIVVRTSSCGPTCAWSHQLRLTSAGKFEHYAYDGGLKSVTGSTIIVPGQWYFVIGTAQNGGIIRLYVNGNEEGTPVSLGTLWTGGDRYIIGSNSGGGINYFNGIVDEVRVYNRALSASEISALYASNTDIGMSANFGGSNMYPTFVNAAQLAATTPAHTAGSVSVSVTNVDGNFASCSGTCFTYIEPIPPSQCNDTLDNDGDLFFDTDDAGCSSPSDDSEGSNNLTLSASPVLLTTTVVGGSSALATSSATFVTITPQAGFTPGSQVTLILDKSASHAVAQNLVSRFVRAGTIMPEVTLTFSDPPTPQSVVFRLGVPHNTALGTYEPIVIRAKDTDKTANVTLRVQDPAGNTGER